MPTLLDERLVADALGALKDWRGDPSGISRQVTLPADVTEALLKRVTVAAEAMDHHPDVERSATGVTFTLRTHSAGGVTELDISLASRIDDLVRQLMDRPATHVPQVSGADSQPARPDADVVAEAARAADPVAADDPTSAAERPPDRGEPVSGNRSASGVPLTPLPDTVPGEPQPGLAADEGQGLPPAGQGGPLPDDRGGPGDPA